MTLETPADPELVFRALPGSDASSILGALAARIAAAGVDVDADELYTLLREREELGSTAIGSGVAVPHCKIRGLDHVVIALGLAAEAIDFGADDGKPVGIFFTVLSPEKEPAAHLRALAAISRWVQENRAILHELGEREPAKILKQLAGTAT